MPRWILLFFMKIDSATDGGGGRLFGYRPVAGFKHLVATMGVALTVLADEVQIYCHEFLPIIL